MRCRVRDKFTAVTPKGEMELQPGQVANISDENLIIELINERKITPLEDVSWLIYSEILRDFLWAVPDEEARRRLFAEGSKEAVYTEEEIDLLREASRETLKTVHAAKKELPGSMVTPNGSQNRRWSLPSKEAY